MISILTVNYNTEKEIARCIESVFNQKAVNFELYVLDNASRDKSVSVLKQYGDRIHLTISERNLGFGKANNLLCQQVSTPYIYLMNPDAWLENPHTLSNLVAFMQTHPEYGIIGATMLNAENVPTLPNYHYPDERHLRHPLPPLPGDIAWILGANMLIPTDLFRRLNGFDESFFLYGEDTDFCLRVRKAGYQIGHLSEITIHRIGGASEKYHNSYETELKKCDGRYRFYQKHYHLDDIKRRINRDYYRACYRAFNYRFAYLLTRTNSYQKRYHHYRAIMDAAKKFRSEPILA